LLPPASAITCRDNRRFNILVDDSDERCRDVFPLVCSAAISFAFFEGINRTTLYPLIKALVETLDCQSNTFADQNRLYIIS